MNGTAVKRLGGLGATVTNSVFEAKNKERAIDG